MGAVELRKSKRFLTKFFRTVIDIANSRLTGMFVAAFFLWFGVRQFRKTERNFADLI